MNLKELSAALKIDKELPESLVGIFDSVIGKKELYGKEYICYIQGEYRLFEERIFDLILGAHTDVLSREELLSWLLLSIEYIKECKSSEEMQMMPMPEPDGTPAGDFLSLLAILPFIERGIREYEKRGFSRESALREFGVFNEHVRWREDNLGRAMFPPASFRWTSRHLFARIFRSGSLSFELTEILHSIAVLENKITGNAEVVMTDRKFHKSGLVFGGPGLTDEEDSFEADFVETENEFIACRAVDGCAEKERIVYPKNEWKISAQRGDDAVYIHIPGDADLSFEALKHSIRDGMRIIKTYYPERKDKFCYTRTWLLSSGIADFLDPSSKILTFAKIFKRYPTPTDGMEIMGYLFPSNIEKTEDLPESTSLQRRVKKFLLEGGHIYGGGGIITDNEFYV